MRREWNTVAMAAAMVIAGLVGPAVAQGRQDGRAKAAEPARFEVSRATSAIRVDGVIEEPAWTSAAAVPLAFEWAPGDNVAPPVPTVCFVTYDEDQLYLACRAGDPDPSAIRARLADRDTLAILQQDDHVMFLIDPFNDQRRAFEFRVNARGVQVDALFSSVDGTEDFSWDAIWASAGRITSSGYEVEVAIPFRSIRFPRSTRPQTWGFIAERSWPRSVRYRIQSAPRDRSNACLLCQANRLDGLGGIAPGRNMEVVPTVTSSRTDTRHPFPDGSLQRGTPESTLGLDARWSPRPNLSVNATINPDFSQVEADVAQLEVNSRFALSYPEKRHFFLEGADFFATPIQAVFTRSIADPTFGAKVTGKVGRQALGVFVARDSMTNILLPANAGTGRAFLDQEATTVVGRVRRDIAKASYIGALLTSRHGDDYDNRVAGVDLFHQMSRTNSVRAQVLISGTRDAASIAAAAGHEATRRVGTAVSAEFVHWSRNWVARAKAQDFSGSFRADAGFVPRVDTRSITGSAVRLVRRPKGWFTQINAGVFAGRTENRAGLLTDQYIGAEVYYQGPRQTTILGGMYRVDERVGGVVHGQTNGAVTVTVRPTGAWMATLGVQGGDTIDYANGRPATRLALTPGVEVSLAGRVTLAATHSYERLTRGGALVVSAHLFQPKAVLHLGHRSFVRALVQYRRIDRNPLAFGVPVNGRDESLLAQLLYSYKVNPQTLLFVGYGDSQLGTDRIDLTRRSRTFFVKLGYAWRP